MVVASFYTHRYYAIVPRFMCIILYKYSHPGVIHMYVYAIFNINNVASIVNSQKVVWSLRCVGAHN